ncbi:MAG: tetratricopeptide repeat protein [Desulfobacteraceae bacterium]|nr:tetratricopeptide repeat protein [Desulfobacteraceae bacterium]
MKKFYIIISGLLYRQFLLWISKLSVEKTAFAILLVFLFAINPISFSFSHLAYAGPVQDGFDAYEKGEYEKALKLFIDAQLEDPDKPEILYNIGNAYYKTGDYDSAANSFKQALKSEDKRLRQKAYYNLGNSNFKKDDLENAIKNYEEAVKLDSNDENAKQNLEFAKKVMELKKQQEQQYQDNQDNQDNQDQDQDKEEQDKESEDQKDGENGQEDQDKEKSGKEGDKKEGEQEKPSPEYGDEKEGEQESGSKQEKEDKEGDEEKEGAAKANPSENPEEQGDKRQAEHMLNRLKDQPGRAMIPVYQKRRVEKDW